MGLPHYWKYVFERKSIYFMRLWTQNSFLFCAEKKTELRCQKKSGKSVSHCEFCYKRWISLICSPAIQCVRWDPFPMVSSVPSLSPPEMETPPLISIYGCQDLAETHLSHHVIKVTSQGWKGNSFPSVLSVKSFQRE